MFRKQIHVVGVSVLGYSLINTRQKLAVLITTTVLKPVKFWMLQNKEKIQAPPSLSASISAVTLVRRTTKKVGSLVQ